MHERRYLVLEWDQGTRNEHAKLIAYMAQRGPLVMIVDSGGKSLHAWFSAIDASEAELEWFFGEACELGAEQKIWNLNAYVRLPGGWRPGKQRRQRIIYFDPKQI